MLTEGESLRREAGKQAASQSGVPKPVILAGAGVGDPAAVRRALPPRAGFLVLTLAAPEEILPACRRMAPCVLIIDADLLSRMDQRDMEQAIQYGRAVQVIVSVDDPEDPACAEYLRSGCLGIVQHGTAPAMLRKAVLSVLSGEIWASRRLITSTLLGYLEAERSPKLTSRESEILGLITAGMSNRSIANKLSISHETVRWHIRALHAKLRLHGTSRTSGCGRESLTRMPAGIAPRSRRHPILLQAIGG